MAVHRIQNRAPIISGNFSPIQMANAILCRLYVVEQFVESLSFIGGFRKATFSEIVEFQVASD